MFINTWWTLWLAIWRVNTRASSCGWITLVIASSVKVMVWETGASSYYWKFMYTSTQAPCLATQMCCLRDLFEIPKCHGPLIIVWMSRIGG